MKKNILAILVIFVLIFSVFTGCKKKESGLNVNERIKAFVKDLNNPPPRHGIYKKHFSSSSPFYNGDENTLKVAFPPAKDYGVSISGIRSTRSVTITGKARKSNWIFNMKNEGKDGKDNWKIMSYE